MEKPLLVLFDGNAIVHRAYHAFGPTRYRQGTALTVSKTGEVVSAVYGFALMLLKVLADLKPTNYAIAFDKKGPTFRHKMYEPYKAQRPPTPDELVDQFVRVREMVRAARIPLYEIDGYEADDIIGTLSRQASERGLDTVIVTGDADTMQLVTDRVRVMYPKAGKTFSDTRLFDPPAVEEKYSVSPEHIVDLKALVGDASDNIPGVSGIGQKTAVKLIGEYGSLEDIYAHLDEVAPAGVQQKLREGEDIGRRSKTLATIVTDVPFKLDLDESSVEKFDRAAVSNLFRELEFYSLLPKLPGEEGAEAAATVTAAVPEVDYRIVSSTDDLDALVAELGEAKAFAFDTETTGVNPMRDSLVGISLSAKPGRSCYIPVGHTLLDAVTQLPLQQVVDRLQPLFEDEKIAKYGHNGKFDMNVLAGQGIAVRNLAFDSMIAAFLLGEKSVGLKPLAFARLGVEMTNISELIGTGSKQRTMAEVDITLAGTYAAADADMTLRLTDLFRGELEKQGLTKLFTDVEMPLVPVLLDMERNGVAVDTAILKEMSGRFGEQIAELEKQIYTEAGHEFNINSPAQLGKVLFEELKLPGVRKSKGKYSTGAGVLESIRSDEYPIIGYILQYRQLAKLKSTYIDTLPALVNPATGRIHTTFNQTRAVTGRLSSQDPNMQNIPVRGEIGGQVRQAFVPGRGNTLFAADYSQIDLRALAHLSGDEELVRAFKHDDDIHAATAARLFNVSPDEVTKDQRRFAKTINFGVIYGMSEYGLQQATEFSREEAAKFIAQYFEKYPGVRRYLDGTKEKARRTGYVETLLGRRRKIPDINAANRQVREAAERMAINMPVQGTSADIIKVAMIDLSKQMRQKKLASKMLLQVHDELVFEVPDAETDEMRALVPRIMDSAVALKVPLKVDTKAGANWGEMREIALR
jgi:DNA polymerase-1